MDEDNQEEQLEESSLKQLQDDLDIANNNWKRALADFENYKRRKEAENKELVQFAREVTVVKLLPTIDSLEQALRHLPEYTPTTPSRSAGHPSLAGGEAPQLSADRGGASPPDKGEYLAKRGEGVGADDFAKHYQNWQTGVNGIIVLLDKALTELGVKKIEALGKKFNPHFHEAVREVESEQDDGIVIDELQTGFELNGKVIRPSQVIISKKKAS
jgi:molecular chaperone GrpE